MLVLSGDRDPVGGAGGSRVTALVELLQGRGLPVEQHLYPEARHEIFNETNRDEVTADVLAWIEQRLAG